MEIAPSRPTTRATTKNFGPIMGFQEAFLCMGSAQHLSYCPIRKHLLAFIPPLIHLLVDTMWLCNAIMLFHRCTASDPGGTSRQYSGDAGLSEAEAIGVETRRSLVCLKGSLAQPRTASSCPIDLVFHPSNKTSVERRAGETHWSHSVCLVGPTSRRKAIWKHVTYRHDGVFPRYTLASSLALYLQIRPLV